jgi:two-component system response regulator GlrR
VEGVIKRKIGMQESRIFLIDWCSPSEAGSTLKKILNSCEGMNVQIHQDTRTGCESAGFESLFRTGILNFNPHIIILILSSIDLNQAEAFIQFMRDQSYPFPVMAVNEDGRAEEIIKLLRVGFADFIIHPMKIVDVLPRIWRLLEHKRTEDPLVHRLKEKIGLRQMIGENPSFLKELEKIPLMAKCDVNVLISGETGTGKELFARAIHYLSPRAGKPFIPASCGAIPVELVENELFGHIQGAFTSATSSQPGLIQEAHGGTLFLDEIDCLPLLAQVKLLRFLQEKEYKQLGSAKVHHADIRVVAATNIDLEKAVKEGKFRQDLYYRLNIIPLSLPPLRERKEDIPPLANHFVEKYASEFSHQAKRFTSEALQRLLLYDWPGNVRELENVIERAVIFSKKTAIEPADIVLSRPETTLTWESFRMAKAKMIEQFEKKYIQALLVAYQGNISKAAEAVQKNRRAFWELIRKYKIDVPSIKSTLKLG